MPALPLKRRRRIALGAVSAVGLATAAGWAAAARASAGGNLPRVVSVGGALTEIVFRLGAESLLVGTDTTSVYPEAAEATPKVGYARALSAEGVLSLRPTVVIASAEAGPPTVIAQLRDAGVMVIRAVPGHDVEALLRNVRLVAAAVERATAGEALAASLQRQWQAVQSRVRRKGLAPRVLFVLSHAANNVQVSGGGTAAHALIAAAGGANAMSGFDGYRPLTAEAVLAAAPEAILTTVQGLKALGGEQRLLTGQPGLALTPAGRAQRVLARDALYLLGGGPRMPEAVRDVATFLGTFA
jgi:ABC-type hemin transport system, periplasmic component